MTHLVSLIPSGQPTTTTTFLISMEPKKEYTVLKDYYSNNILSAEGDMISDQIIDHYVPYKTSRNM